MSTPITNLPTLIPNKSPFVNLGFWGDQYGGVETQLMTVYEQLNAEGNIDYDNGFTAIANHYPDARGIQVSVFSHKTFSYIFEQKYPTFEEALQALSELIHVPLADIKQNLHPAAYTL